MMDDWKETKAGKVHSYLDFNEDNANLAFPTNMVEDLKASSG